ncbi:MAG: hypothetical protein BWX71_01498 [Deltaproteobacteria bacterium ADurb.Bin072]|nr:MAG: hypothetical protein BWX71_01498 [Deltaproteobacteria bacterium ADurb.Bin072]
MKRETNTAMSTMDRIHATARPKASSMPKFLNTSMRVVAKVSRLTMVVSALMVTGIEISVVEVVGSPRLRWWL